MASRQFPKLLALGLAATLATATAGWAAETTQAPAPPKPSAHARFQKALGLSDDQMAAIKEVHARHAAEQRQLWQSLRVARAELNQAALNGGDVKGKTAALTGLLAQLTELRATTLQEISPILTPEQRTAMAQMGARGHWHRNPRPTQS